jgi:guanylate kinase
MGKSGSGKDTIFKRLSEDGRLQLKGIVLYTTRPKRDNETNGIEYHFIGEGKLKKFIELGKIIELREYDTVNGKWYYGTVDDGQIDLEKNNYIIITTLEAYTKLQAYYGMNSVEPVYITLDDGIRLERALKREMQQEEPNYEELCRRYLADSIDFSKEQLKACNINKFYLNYELQECVDNIYKDILKIINE